MSDGRLAPAAIAASCESIGRNCEFGLVQRNMGLEPIHLLRWAGSQMPGLVAAFENGFDGLADEMTGSREETPDDHPHSRWLLTCQRYGIAFHVEAPREAGGPEQAGAASVKRLRWQARRLLDGIAACERILVYSSRQIAAPAECEALVSAIRRYGETPILLVGQSGRSTGRVTPTLWPGVWFASAPILTRMDWAGGVDQGAWTAILENFADAIQRVIPVTRIEQEINVMPEPEETITPIPSYQTLETEGFSDPDRAPAATITEAGHQPPPH